MGGDMSPQHCLHAPTSPRAGIPNGRGLGDRATPFFTLPRVSEEHGLHLLTVAPNITWSRHGVSVSLGLRPSLALKSLSRQHSQHLLPVTHSGVWKLCYLLHPIQPTTPFWLILFQCRGQAAEEDCQRMSLCLTLLSAGEHEG